VPAAAGHNAFIMPIHGVLTIGGERFDAEEPRLPVYPAQTSSQEITLRNEGGTAKAVLFSEAPARPAGALARIDRDGIARGSRLGLRGLSARRIRNALTKGLRDQPEAGTGLRPSLTKRRTTWPMKNSVPTAPRCC
jgi:hypothetical protein